MNSSEKEILCNLFVSDNNIPRYILGKNPFAQSVIKVLPNGYIDGIIDEFTKDNYFMGIPIVHKLSALPPNAIVLSAALLNPITVKRKFSLTNIKIIDYFSLLHYCPNLPIKKICFWEGFVDSYSQHRKEYDAILEQLADEESKDIFNRIIDFRLNYNIDAMDIFSDRQKEQYFEPFLNLKSNCSFIDVGGYDGYTTKEFIKRFPNYEKVWFFEPEEHNLTIAKQFLKDYERIVYCPVAASDNEGELRFEPSNDSSRISNEGSVVVRTSLIDNYVTPPCKKSIDRYNHIFMKMDIEGAEEQALNGAKKTILKYHPTMAISVYHKGSDLIDIPKQVFSIRDDYKVYLRHYTEGISETVMFFVPC